MNEQSYTPQHIANYFLARAQEEGRNLTPLKLLKLVYIAYGWVLALTGRRLFEEEIQAWQHGPVIPSLYHEFKHFGREPVTERAQAFDLDSFDVVRPEVPESDKETALILDKVWSAYKAFSGWALRNKTHASDTPWSDVYEDGRRNIVIPDEKIADHYRKRIEKYLDAAS